MNWFTRTMSVLLFATSAAFAQLIIENPKHLTVPEDQARTLLRISCQAVAKELHLPDKRKIEFGFRLVLGANEEHFGLDEKTGTPTLSLSEWNPEKFTTAAVRFAVERSIDTHREEQVILQVLRRSAQISPISAAQLNGFVAYPKTTPVQDRNDCLDGISNAGVRDVQCGALPDKKHLTAK